MKTNLLNKKTVKPKKVSKLKDAVSLMIPVYDSKKEKVGEIELPKNVFGVKWNPNLVHQVFVSEISNARVNLAHTKGRGEVRGGGKKPWAQKHTGRARASSTRSPIWVGGGVALGPTNERNFKKKINKKMRKIAFFSTLSKKLSDNEVGVISDLNLKDAKTKIMAKIMNNLFKGKIKVLCVTLKDNKNAVLAGRNIPGVKVVNPQTLSLYDILAYKNVLFEKNVISEIK